MLRLYYWGAGPALFFIVDTIPTEAAPPSAVFGRWAPRTPISNAFWTPLFIAWQKKQERDDFAVTDEHARQSSQQPTRETATGGASRAVFIEYGWASPHDFIHDQRCANPKNS